MGHRPPDATEVRATYAEAAAGYDRAHRDGDRQRKTEVIEAPLRELARRARRLLDLGAGTGRLLRETGRPDGIALDFSIEMLRAGGSGRRVCADAQRLPFADRSFDGIIAAGGVFRYLDYARAFAECARVLA